MRRGSHMPSSSHLSKTKDCSRMACQNGHPGSARTAARVEVARYLSQAEFPCFSRLPGRRSRRHPVRSPHCQKGKVTSDNVQPARQRGIAEGEVRLARKGGPDGGNERLLWIGQLHLRLGKGSRNGSDCITGAVHGCCRPPRSGHQSSRRLILSVWP